MDHKRRPFRQPSAIGQIDEGRTWWIRGTCNLTRFSKSNPQVLYLGRCGVRKLQVRWSRKICVLLESEEFQVLCSSGYILCAYRPLIR